MGRHPRTFSSIILAALFCESIASAQVDRAAPSDTAPAKPPETDQGTSNTDSPSAEKPEVKLPWRGTAFAWDQSATSQTVGIGSDYLSANPTYDMTFSLEPAWVVFDDDVNRIRVNGYIGLFHEFTNSDTTTKQGETSVSGGTSGTDAMLTSEYSRKLYEQGKVRSVAAVRVPVLTFPTSKASIDAGVILGLGGRLKFLQAFPIAPAGAGFLESGDLGVAAGYSHKFTRAIEPVNPDLQRVRLDTNGQSVAGDQLEGAPFAEHTVPISVTADLDLTDRLTLSTGFAWVLVWKYPLATPVDVCGVVATGCTPAQEPSDPQRFGVITQFSADLSVALFDELDVHAGYENVALQVGPDGQRRNMFYSPDARVALGVVVHLDALYLRASGESQPDTRTPSRSETARRSTSSSVE